MERLDQQFWQLKENYEHLTEGEICSLAEDAYDLTEIAREARRGMHAPGRRHACSATGRL